MINVWKIMWFIVELKRVFKTDSVIKILHNAVKFKYGSPNEELVTRIQASDEKILMALELYHKVYVKKQNC